jgi:hypothetical protein
MLYWFGVPVVAVYGRLADVLPLHTEGLAPNVMVGVRSIVTEIGLAALTQPDVVFVTVIAPEYVPGKAPPGTVITMGVAGRAALTTSTNPCASAAALKSMLY